MTARRDQQLDPPKPRPAATVVLVHNTDDGICHRHSPVPCLPVLHDLIGKQCPNVTRVGVAGAHPETPLTRGRAAANSV